MSEDNIFDDSMTCDITQYADVRGLKYSDGERRRRIDKASDHELLLLKEACWTQGSTDTLALVEKEQSKRLKKQIPEWKMISTWIGVAGVILAILSWLFPRT